MNIVYCRLNRPDYYIDYSSPFGGGSIKLRAHVLHYVSITVVKKIKVSSQISSLFDAKETVFWKS